MLSRALPRTLLRPRGLPSARLPAVYSSRIVTPPTSSRPTSCRTFATPTPRVSPSPERLARQKAAAAGEAEPILPTDANATPLEQTEQPELKLPKDPFEVGNDEPAAGGAGGSGGAGSGGKEPPKSAYISSTDRRRTARARYSGYAALLALLAGTLYLGRALEPEEREAHPDITDDWSDYFARVNARRRDLMAFYNEPPFDKLLPDMIPEYGRPYTLVIALEDLMVHSSWDREHGWRIAKRPGLDYFLAYLFQYYEIVVFTNQPDSMAAPIIQKVDHSPGYIMYPLFRAHTRYVDGKYIKDLKYLNRDLSKVVMLETNPDAWSANPDNTLKLAPWKGDAADRELVALIPFLEYIAALGVDDVRTAIKSYDGTHIPTEFARREELIRAELRKELGARKKNPGPPAWLLAILGLKPSPKKDDGDVKTFMDLARERGQEHYLATQKHLEAHKEELLREQQVAEKEMAEQMKTSLNKIFTEGFPKQPGQ
ncbi:HAD-like domain-containing protein [Geopyxis carbonaria]|nr:HAD-like domain-containing protein [Geopyxis carbonaria]